MKLSKNQTNVIVKLRNGWKMENVNTNSDAPFLFRNGIKISVRTTTIEKLIKEGLLTESKTNFAVSHYHLTDFGNQISIF